MTGPEMDEFINKLSSSGGENVFENYGIGAKFSAVTRNERGIVYESWQSGTGCQAMYQYDENEDAFGLAQFERSEATYSYFQDS